MKRIARIICMAAAVVVSVSASFVFAKLPEIIVFPEEPIPIRTAEELDAIRNGNFGYYVLEEDIDLSEWGEWTPIDCPAGGSHHELCIRFDGGGHTISGITGSGGLFGTVSCADIRDLTVKGDIVSKDGSDVGGIIGCADAASQYGEEIGVTLTNCRFEGSIAVSLPDGVKDADNAVGGLIGRVIACQDERGGRSKVELRSCSCSIAAEGCMRYAGGLIGYLGVSQKGNPAADTSALVQDCWVDASIAWKPEGLITSAQAERCGGGLIGMGETIGSCSGGATALSVLSSGCSSGSLTGFVQAGGLIGVLRGEGHCTIDGCGSGTEICSAADRFGCYGGLAGFAQASGGGMCLTFSNEHAYNAYDGKITVDSAEALQTRQDEEELRCTYAGGLFGVLRADYGTVKIELSSIDSHTEILVEKSQSCLAGQLLGAFQRGPGVNGFLSVCVPYAHNCVYGGSFEDRVNGLMPFIASDEYADLVFQDCYSSSSGEDINIGTHVDPWTLYAGEHSVQRFLGSVQTLEYAPDGWIPVMNLSDLQAIGDSEGSFILMSDLTAEGWDPAAAGKESSGMACVSLGTAFNGNGFCLTGIDASANGLVKNLGLEGGRLSAQRVENCWRGGEVPAAYAFKAKEISGCVNYAPISNTSAWWEETSPFCAPFEGTAVRGCVNYGDVTASGTCGGIVSCIDDSGSACLENCVNYGTITVTAPKSSGSSGKMSPQDICAGGIAGTAVLRANAIKGCSSFGSISVSVSSGQAACAGGIVGKADVSLSAIGSDAVLLCGNAAEGSVRAESGAGAYAGGLIGKLAFAYGGKGSCAVSINACFADAGRISASGDTASQAGGFIGCADVSLSDADSAFSLALTDCESYADIAAQKGAVSASAGIGKLQKGAGGSFSVTLTNCAVHGSVSPDAGAESAMKTVNCLLDTDGRAWTRAAGEAAADRLNAYAKANGLPLWGLEKDGRPSLNKGYHPQISAGSGKLEEYFIASSGTPIPGEGTVVWDGAHFYVCETTADRKVMSYWFSAEGELLVKEVLADLSGCKGDLSQPSACVLNGVVYVGYVARPETDEESGIQYIASTAYGRKTITRDVIVSEGVWPRKPALAAGKDGLLLIWRNCHTKCFATYIKTEGVSGALKAGPTYQVYKDEWDEYGGSFAIYPSACYAPEKNVFLAAWDAGTTIRGAIVSPETKETPESFELISGDWDDFDQPRTAWNGSAFCVCAQTGGSVAAALVNLEGSVTASHVPVVAYNNTCYDGQVAWDGECWLMSYSRSRASGYSNNEQPDFRHVDSYLCRLDANTLRICSVTSGIATAWWHQSHSRFALNPEGKIFCTYLNDAGGVTDERWCLIDGLPSKLSGRALMPSGLCMTRDTDDAADSPVSSAGDGQTVYVYNGALHSRTYDSEWTSYNGSTSPVAVYGLDVKGSTCILTGWAAVSEWMTLTENAASAEGFDANGEGVPGTGVFLASENTAYLCASGGTVWRKDKTSRDPVCVYDARQIGLDFHDIAGNSASDIYAGGDRGLLVHYDGKAWSVVETGVCAAINDIWPNGQGGAFIACDGGVLLRVKGDDCTDVWTVSEGNLYGVWGASADYVFACGENGTILLFDGSSWKTVDYVNEYGEKPDTMPLFTQVFGAVSGRDVLVYVADCFSYGETYVMRCAMPEQGDPVLKVTRAGRKVTVNPRGDQLRSNLAFIACYDEDGRLTGLSVIHSGSVEMPGEDDDIRVYYTTVNYEPICEPIEAVEP